MAKGISSISKIELTQSLLGLGPSVEFDTLSANYLKLANSYDNLKIADGNLKVEVLQRLIKSEMSTNPEVVNLIFDILKILSKYIDEDIPNDTFGGD